MIPSFDSVSVNTPLKLLYNEHYPSILVTILRKTEHFSGENGALRWGILVGKQKYNVLKPNGRFAI